MTPRQLAAFAFLAGRRRERDLAQYLGVISMGTNGDGDQVKKMIAKYEEDQ